MTWTILCPNCGAVPPNSGEAAAGQTCALCGHRVHSDVEPVRPTEGRYGFSRTRCGCELCQAYCRYVPGRLDVADLERLCPEGQDVFHWAEHHLRAVTDTPYPKLVPVRRSNGHCHWYLDGKCLVHQNAPYGCAYFDSHMDLAEVTRRSRAASRASREDADRNGLFSRVWRYLRDRGLTTPPGDRDGLDAEMARIQRGERPR